MHKSLTMLLAVAFCLSALCASAGEAKMELPDKVKNAPPNTLVNVCEGMVGQRYLGALFLPEESRFFIFGLFYQHRGSPDENTPCAEMTFDPAKCAWEALAGSDKKKRAEALPPDIYCWSMNPFNNYAYDPDRHKLLATFCVPHDNMKNHRFFLEYDIPGHTWSRVAGTEALPPEFWEDVAMGAICYDPVNKEMLGVQGRWTSKGGKWTEMKLGSDLINGLRERSQAVWLPVRNLGGACRARYYVAESEEETKVKLDAVANEVLKKATDYAAELAKAEGQAKDAYEKVQLGWARANAEKALGILRALPGKLGGAITSETVWAAEDARDALKQIAVDLAVAPPKRCFSQVACDAKNGKIAVFGGHALDRLLADTWVYDCKERRWRDMRPKLSPAPRWGHGLVYLPKSGKILLVDGQGYGDRPEATPGELWTYDTTTNEWAMLAGEPGRMSLTGWRHYKRQMGPVAAGPDDTVLMISFLPKEPTALEPPKTWMARIDAAKVDAAEAAKRGVPPGTEKSLASRDDEPRWYEQKGGDIAAAVKEQEAWLAALAPNVWAKRGKALNQPYQNRAYNKITYDPERRELLHWGGGHVAYTGNIVLQYSLRANRFFIGHRPEWAPDWPSIGPYGKAVTYQDRPFMTDHARNIYDYDPVLKKVVVGGFGRARGYGGGCPGYARGFLFDPNRGDWQMLGETPFDTSPAATTFCGTPEGHFVWAQDRGMWRLDQAKFTWEKLPVNGNLPTAQEYDSMVFDPARKCLLLFLAKGNVVEYDIKTHAATTLTPTGNVATSYKRPAWMPDRQMYFGGARVKDAEGNWRWLFYDLKKRAWLGLRLTGDDPLKGEATAFNSFGAGYDPQSKVVLGVDNYTNVWVCKPDLDKGDVKVLAEMKPAGKGTVK